MLLVNAHKLLMHAGVQWLPSSKQHRSDHHLQTYLFNGYSKGGYCMAIAMVRGLSSVNHGFHLYVSTSALQFLYEVTTSSMATR